MRSDDVVLAEIGDGGGPARAATEAARLLSGHVAGTFTRVPSRPVIGFRDVPRRTDMVTDG